MLLRLAPVFFVLLWSTGWINAQAAAPHSDPLTFLGVRYALAALALAALLPVLGAPFPRDRRFWLHGFASGVLLHAVYLGGVWWAIDSGLPTPISGLIAAVQPLLTAVLAVLLIRERLIGLQWLGLVLGLVGLVLGLAEKFAGVSAQAGLTLLVLVNVAAMVSVTLGTLYQKRFLVGAPLPSLVMAQNIGACAVTLPVALLFETFHIAPNWDAALSMTWSVLALSIGAVLLLLYMISQGAVSRVATLIYLIPPAVAVEAYLLFGESLSALQLVGMGVTVLGVYLVNRPAKTAAHPSASSN